MNKEIERVVHLSDKRFTCIAGEDSNNQIWHCNECKFHFMRKARTFNSKKIPEFCKACNKLVSNATICESHFMKILQKYIMTDSKYKHLIFLIQAVHPELRSVKKSAELFVDFCVLDSHFIIRTIEDAVGFTEINESGHRSYASNQDGARDNYERKMEFYKKLNIPIISLSYHCLYETTATANDIAKFKINAKATDLVLDTDKYMDINEDGKVYCPAFKKKDLDVIFSHMVTLAESKLENISIDSNT